MKELKFDANLGFQLEAISAITDIFDGQKVCQSNFTVRRNEVEENLKLGVQGYANELQLIDEELLENVHAIQLLYSAKRFAQEGKNSLLTSDRFAQTSCFNLIKTLYTFI